MGGVLTGYLAGYRGTADALLSRIRELESLDYPTPLSRKLLWVLKAAVEESTKVVDALVANPTEVDESAVIRHWQLLSLIHMFVHLISTSVGSDVPRWAIQPMKYEIGKFLKTDVDILIVGNNEGGNFAYDYRLDRLTRILTGALGTEITSALTAGLPKQMAIFHFPFGERDNVLAHGAFFHEVGHQIDIGISRLSEQVLKDFFGDKDAGIREQLREAGKAFIEGAFGKSEGDQTSIGDEQAELLLEGLVKALQTALVSWAQEFCADLIATRILGPAYAMVVVISPALLSNLKHHSATHPATLLRLKFVLRLLSDPRAGDFFSNSAIALKTAGIHDLLDDWRSRCAQEPSDSFRWHQPVSDIARDRLHVVIVGLAEELGARVLDAVVQATTGHDYYTPAQYNQDIADLLPTLQSWVTINERIDHRKRVHTPSDIATIFNVGIACYLQQRTAEARTRLNRLLRKSIELSQVQRQLQS